MGRRCHLDQGDLLQERYRIVRYIKKGGMGAVYEARDTKLADSPCAVKEILETARLGEDSQYIESRFYQEMKALAALDHHSIPKVRDYLTVNSVVYIVMELVQGQSLEDEIDQAVGLSGQPQDPEKSVQDILALLETVAYLHQQEPAILHRDIKPANILRETRSGRIKLVDFGLARQLDENSRHTLVGTLGYCAPEQMMGKGGLESDIYSVGVTLYHLLTGIRPETLNFEPLRPDLPNLRPGLAEIVEKATQLRPVDRYPSCEEMSAALQAWLEGRPMAAASPATTIGNLPLKPPSRGVRSPLAAGIVAVALALAAGLYLGRESAPVAPPVAAAQPSLPAQPARPPEVTPARVEPAVVAEMPPPPAPVSPSPVAPQPQPKPAVVQVVPRAEVEPAPAYPTYNGPPSVGFQPAPEQPNPNIEQGGPPALQQARSNFPTGRNRRTLNRWRNHRRGR